MFCTVICIPIHYLVPIAQSLISLRLNALCLYCPALFDYSQITSNFLHEIAVANSFLMKSNS